MKGCVSCLEMKSIYQDVRKVGHSLNIQLQRGLDLRAWRAGQSFTDLYLVTPLSVYGGQCTFQHQRCCENKKENHYDVVTGDFVKAIYQVKYQGNTLRRIPISKPCSVYTLPAV